MLSLVAIFVGVGGAHARSEGYLRGGQISPELASARAARAREKGFGAHRRLADEAYCSALSDDQLKDQCKPEEACIRFRNTTGTCKSLCKEWCAPPRTCRGWWRTRCARCRRS